MKIQILKVTLIHVVSHIKYMWFLIYFTTKTIQETLHKRISIL